MTDDTQGALGKLQQRRVLNVTLRDLIERGTTARQELLRHGYRIEEWALAIDESPNRPRVYRYTLIVVYHGKLIDRIEDTNYADLVGIQLYQLMGDLCSS